MLTDIARFIKSASYKRLSPDAQCAMLVLAMNDLRFAVCDDWGCGIDRFNECVDGVDVVTEALEDLQKRIESGKPDESGSELEFTDGLLCGTASSVLLVGTLNALAEKTKNGIIDFDAYADAPDRYGDWVVYDRSNMKVVCDACVDDIHRDIVGYYDFIFGANIHVIEDGSEDSPLIEATIPGGTIVVDGGRWYIASYDFPKAC